MRSVLLLLCARAVLGSDFEWYEHLANPEYLALLSEDLDRYEATQDQRCPERVMRTYRKELAAGYETRPSESERAHWRVVALFRVTAVCPPCRVGVDWLRSWSYNFTSRVPECEQGVRAFDHHFRMITRFPLLDSAAGGERKSRIVGLGAFHQTQKGVAESASYEDCTRVNRWYQAHYGGFLAAMLNSHGVPFQAFERGLKRVRQELPASVLDAWVWERISGVPTVWNCSRFAINF